MSLSAPWNGRTLILRRDEIRLLLDLRTCIDAVERAFLAHASSASTPPSSFGFHVEGGGFHVKTAAASHSVAGRPAFAAKINANFPCNPDRNGLPTIQGVLALFDAADGRLLALLDSIEITTLRTAAATAVAAKYLAPDRAAVAICGCGEQARSQLRALACVRPIERVAAIDIDRERAARFGREMAAELDIDVEVARAPADVAHRANVWITCTTSRRWLLGREHVAAGSFVAAVGADNPHKQEIEPELMAASAIIVDILDQCAAIGDLHHALESGLMQRAHVRAELAEVLSGTRAGRRSADEIVIFDSTGTALEDLAAAAIVFEHAQVAGAGTAIELGKGWVDPLTDRGARRTEGLAP
jgi:ornithine cyclodeaminase/alanine dehydrogenase-like protein (mu-crystallin family)